VRDDPRAIGNLGKYVSQDLLSRPVDEVQEHHGGGREIDSECVLTLETGQMGDAGEGRVGPGLLDPIRFDVDAHAVSSAIAGRGNDEPTVATSEVEHDIARLNLGQFEHAGDDIGRRGDVRREDVERCVRHGYGEQLGERDQQSAYSDQNAEFLIDLQATLKPIRMMLVSGKPEALCQRGECVNVSK
jgi:hypothetical protein